MHTGNCCAAAAYTNMQLLQQQPLCLHTDQLLQPPLCTHTGSCCSRCLRKHCTLYAYTVHCTHTLYAYTAGQLLQPLAWPIEVLLT
jgi:hypothetical protein